MSEGPALLDLLFAPGWTEHDVFGQDEEVFYFHAESGVVQWEPPPIAEGEVREVLGAPGWEQHFSLEDGEVFYLHLETEAAQWEPPVCYHEDLPSWQLSVDGKSQPWYGGSFPHEGRHITPRSGG